MTDALRVQSPRVRAWTALLVVILASLRLAHINLLWTDEDYHLAAAIQVIRGRLPYRDFLYDKPPLSAFFYALIGGHAGWPLRLLDTAYVLAACWVAYLLAKRLWSEQAGLFAALGLAFFLAFYLPPAVVSFAPDGLMLLPHLLAIYFAITRRPWAAGLVGGIAFLVNTKAVFVLAACGVFLVFDPTIDFRNRARAVLNLIFAFTIVVICAVFVAKATGTWDGYVKQVMEWGVAYAKGSPVAHPFATGVSKTANWLGFHVALALGTVALLWKAPGRARMFCWIALSYCGVALGLRFSPRYFLQLLPAMVIAAAWGWTYLLHRWTRTAAAALAICLLVPLVRFGPRYAMLAWDNLEGITTQWSDAAMDIDSQQVATKLKKVAQPGQSLMVWGCRSDVYVYTRMISDSRFWNSEPITGVPADRHLFSEVPVETKMAQQYRLDLAQTHPDFLVDGLGVLNPKLAPAVYPELRPWLAHYQLVARTQMSLIYRRVR